MKRNTYLISYFLAAIIIAVFLCGCESNDVVNTDTKDKYESVIKNEESSKNEKVQDTEEEKVIKYIEENTVNLSDNNISELSSLLKDDLKDNRLFLRNTEYGVSADYDVDFNLLKYLNKEAGVNYYLSYISYSKAQMINKYLDCGNENLLDILINNNNIVSEEEKNLYKKLYEYNNTLTKDKKIHILGLEFDGKDGCIFKYLNSIIPKQRPPKEISTFINVIQNDEAVDNQFFLNFYNDFEKNHNMYKDYLGENFEKLEAVLQNTKSIIEMVTNYGDISSADKYCEIIKENMVNIIFNNMKSNDNIKCYGNLSYKETFGDYIYYKDIFISELKDDKSPVNGKLVMINTIYNKCRQIITKSRSVSIDSDFEYKEIINQNIKYNTGLINLLREKSPFSENSKNYQYAVFINNYDGQKFIRLTNLDIEEENKLREFLNNNKYNIDICNDKNYNLLSQLGSEFNKYDVIFTGESHGTSYNYDIKLKLLKYYNKKFGFKYYLNELGYASMQFINEYLKTGEEDVLRNVFDNLAGSSEFNQQNYEFYKNLYEYNKGLSKDNKIIVVGVDIEHQKSTAWKYLNTLFPDEEPPATIAEKIKKVRHKFISSKEDKNILEELLQDIQKNTNVYKDYFGDNYFDFKFVSNNILNSINYYDELSNDWKTANKIREENIYENFLKVYNYLPKGKYYGQWGAEHIYQYNRYNQCIDGECFAQKLNGDGSPVKEKVLSIPYMYMDSMRFDRTYNKPETINTKFNQGLLLYDISNTDVTLFKLTGENSPFEKKAYIVDYPQGGVTTDYFQYVILVKNSKATEPYSR